MRDRYRVDPDPAKAETLPAEAFSDPAFLERELATVFAPALRLYESEGFRRCGPFDAYAADAFSVFMTRELR